MLTASLAGWLGRTVFQSSIDVAVFESAGVWVSVVGLSRSLSLAPSPQLPLSPASLVSSLIGGAPRLCSSPHCLLLDFRYWLALVHVSVPWGRRSRRLRVCSLYVGRWASCRPVGPSVLLVRSCRCRWEGTSWPVVALVEAPELSSVRRPSSPQIARYGGLFSAFRSSLAPPHAFLFFPPPQLEVCRSPRA